MKYSGFTMAAALAAAAVGPPRRAAAQTLVVADVSIVDPAAANPITTGSIVVENGRITAIGRSPAAPPGARVIDGRGKFVVPGLWDMHAHLAALTPIGRAPERYVAHGVLNVRDMGGLVDSLFPLRASIRAGDRTGPEIVLAGPTLNGAQPAPFHRAVATAAEARAAVRELATAGVDLIKIHRATSRAAFEAIADESRRLRLPFAGHVPLDLTWIEASQAGMRTIEHIQTLFENVPNTPIRRPEEFMALADRLDGPLGDSIFAVLNANQTFFDPTLVGYEASIDNAPPAVAGARRIAYERMKSIAARAARAGVPILAGTDVLEKHGDLLLTELERLVEIGLTPQEALAAATVTAANAAGRPELGRVTVGAPAGFLILDANPLADIANLRTLRAAVLRGRLIDGDGLAELRQ